MFNKNCFLILTISGIQIFSLCLRVILEGLVFLSLMFLNSVVFCRQILQIGSISPNRHQNSQNFTKLLQIPAEPLKELLNFIRLLQDVQPKLRPQTNRRHVVHRAVWVRKGKVYVRLTDEARVRQGKGEFIVSTVNWRSVVELFPLRCPRRRVFPIHR